MNKDASTTTCPTCKGECCRDDLGCRVIHYGAELFNEHVCEACLDGTKYVPLRTYEDGIAEGERRATADVVAWLRRLAESSDESILVHVATYIEIGAHRDRPEEAK